MKVWKTAVFLLLAIVAIGLFLKLKFQPTLSPPGPGSQTAQTAPAQSLSPVDLAALYDNDPSFNARGCWQAVPRGLQTLGNIPFRIGGFIQLWGEGPAGMGRNYRERVDGIPATGKFQTLYVLHGTSFTSAKGTPIAEVVFRYVDGSSATNAILYGTDSRDWWQPLAEHEPLSTNSASKVVWRGDHPDLPDWVKSLRFFGTGIPNPNPASEVKGVDLLSTKSRVTWVVLALTTGPQGMLKVDPAIELDEEVRGEEITMLVSARDKDSGEPIPDTRFNVTLFSGRRPKPFGRFTADKKGEAVIDLPPERIKLVSIQAMAGDYPPISMSWNVAQGERIPTNYVFRLSKRQP